VRDALARAGLASVAALAAAAAGCGGASGTATLALSWQFAAGRQCIDAGAFNVVVTAGRGSLGTFACAAGLAPAQVMIANAPLDGDVAVSAQSAPGLELYRGTLHTNGVPATVTLYATNAR
jgi:hypothetical protein